MTVRLDVHLKDAAQSTIVGFGMPFANHGHISEAWLASSAPLAGGLTLLDLLRQRSFSFVVDWWDKELAKVWDESTLAPPFCYPYGKDHAWDFPRYEKLIPANKVRLILQFPFRHLVPIESALASLLSFDALVNVRSYFRALANDL